VSGFVGILRSDDLPASREAISALTDVLRFRGPDASGLWTEGAIGLGHALLRTEGVHPRERQPATLDGSSRIVGDIRIDARADLLAALDACGCNVANDATDAELALHAYHTWDDACPEHLIGDFAFAIWDAQRRRLLCGRDQMGVRPFYYAQLPKQFLFGNTIDCLRRHPEVSDDLNELAVADFLLFGCNLDVGSSTFAHIRKLPPAHILTVSNGNVQMRRYWTLPIDEPLFYKRAADYVDRFRDLLTTTVRDRLRTERVAVFMSGGLDSPLLAAEARSQLAGSQDVAAFTYVYDRLIPDDERQYAGLAAAHLRIPIRFWLLDDDSESLGGFGSPICPSEPRVEPESYGTETERYREMAAQARVVFYGEGPDNALYYEWHPYLGYLWRNRRWGKMLLDVGRHVAVHRKIPLLATIPGRIRARRDRKKWQIPFPQWLNPKLIDRYDLRGRWQSWNNPPPARHPVRPKGYRSMQTPLWTQLFESLDAGCTRAAMTVRHPYLDLRLLRFLLAVPALPWCRSKLLLHTAARSVLPIASVNRPKSPLQVDPGFARHKGVVAPVSPRQAELLAPFVDPTHFSRASTYSEFEYTIASKPGALGWWLERTSCFAGVSQPQQLHEREGHEQTIDR
jgi:asparagine synthase (glutamine-hydrolysing)